MKNDKPKHIVEHSLTGCIDYDLYNDGSVDIICPKCKQPRALVGKAADDFMKWHKNNPEYVCINCFVGGDKKEFKPKSKFEPKYEKSFDDRSDQIAWNSACNNANLRMNAYIVAGVKLTAEEQLSEEVKLREYYYDIIKNSKK